MEYTCTLLLLGVSGPSESPYLLERRTNREITVQNTTTHTRRKRWAPMTHTIRPIVSAMLVN